MKILVGVNTLNQVDQLAYSNHCQLWYRLGKEMPEIQFAFNSPRRATIDKMRNMHAKLALIHNFDYIVFIDDDVLVPTDCIKRLLACNADIAAGWTIIRGHPFDNMFFKYKDEAKENLARYNDFEVNERGLIDVDAVGFSCCMIKVDLLRNVPPPFFVTGTQNTEDIYFCIKARQAVPDCTIVVDPELKTGHILGSELITPDNKDLFRDFYEKVYPEQVDNQKPIMSRGDGYLDLVKNPTEEMAKKFLEAGQ